MYYVILAIHLLIALLLGIVVLLQRSKGGGLAGAFGGVDFQRRYEESFFVGTYPLIMGRKMHFAGPVRSNSNVCLNERDNSLKSRM